MNGTIVENFLYKRNTCIFTYIYFSPFHLTKLWLAVYKTLLSTTAYIFIIKPENTLVFSVLSENTNDGLLITHRHLENEKEILEVGG